MKIRRPKFDFSASSPHWASNSDFAQFINAASFPVPWLERFLNRVMAKAAASLKDGDESQQGLRGRIRTFIRQEANHYSIHEEFNSIVRSAGYDLASVEQFIISEYERLWQTKSLEFCLAYCEGFETLGPSLAKVWLDEIDDLLVDADPEVVGMWKWHMMEEFEHRTVAFDTFHAISGSYLLRLSGFFYQLWHLSKMNGMVRNILVETDRGRMTAAQIAQSKKRMRRVQLRMSGFAIRTILRVVNPWYSPHALAEPKNFRAHQQLLDAAS